MIVHCADFGSLWWLRPGQDPASSKRFTSQAAIFNTTGFRSGARERRNWTVPGVVRLNAGTCIAQQMRLQEITPGNFETQGMEHMGSQNRLLLHRRADGTAKIDMFMLVVRSDTMGRIEFNEDWRSRGVRIVAASAYNKVQETLLLLPPDGEFTTTKGTWRTTWAGTKSKTEIPLKKP